jgi:hypothetical protein
MVVVETKEINREKIREEKIPGILYLLCSVKLAIIQKLFFCWNLLTRL